MTVTLANKYATSIPNSSSSQTVTVDYLLTGGTASQKSDYTYVAGTVAQQNVIAGKLTFKPDETAQEITLLINDDGYAEGSETVEVTLLNPQGAVLGSTATAILTINDNEAVDSFINPIDERRISSASSITIFCTGNRTMRGWRSGPTRLRNVALMRTASKKCAKT